MKKDPEQKKAEGAAQRLMYTLNSSQRTAEATVRAIEWMGSLTDAELIEYAEYMESPDPVKRLVGRTCFEQGLPLKVTDPLTLDKVARILTAGR